MDRISQLLTKSRQQRSNDRLLLEIHHILMKEYGWISLEEFKELPIPTALNLLNIIEEVKEMEKREAEKSKVRGRR